MRLRIGELCFIPRSIVCNQCNLRLLITTPTERPQHWGAQFCRPPACRVRWLCEGCPHGDWHGTTGLLTPFPKRSTNEHSYQTETEKRGLSSANGEVEGGPFWSQTPWCRTGHYYFKPRSTEISVSHFFIQSIAVAETSRLNTTTSSLSEHLSYRPSQAEVWRASPPL